MQVKAVTKGDAAAGGHSQVAGCFVGEFFKFVLTERIGREQPILTNVPPSGMPRVLRMIKNGHPHGLSVDRAVIVTPISALAPGVSIANARAANDVAVPDRAFKPHGFGKPDGHCALL